MKVNDEEAAEGLNQILEIINAKGDTEELEEIVQSDEPNTNKEDIQ